MIIIDAPSGVYSDTYSVQLQTGLEKWKLCIKRVGLFEVGMIPVIELIPQKRH